MKRLTLAFLLLVIGSGWASADYDLELWNDGVKTNNQWSYYDQDTPSPHDVDMNWHASGGLFP